MCQVKRGREAGRKRNQSEAGAVGPLCDKLTLARGHDPPDNTNTQNGYTKYMGVLSLPFPVDT